MSKAKRLKWWTGCVLRGDAIIFGFGEGFGGEGCVLSI